jgi:hypothetical protein
MVIKNKALKAVVLSSSLTLSVMAFAPILRGQPVATPTAIANTNQSTQKGSSKEEKSGVAFAIPIVMIFATAAYMLRPRTYKPARQWIEPIEPPSL